MFATAAVAALATVLAAVPASADEAGGPIDLGTLPGGLTSYGSLVSNAGTVFGTAFDQRGARWDGGGRITELPPQPGHASVSPVAITEDGVAIGDSMAASGFAGRATLWGASGVPEDLPPVPGFPGYAYSSVAAINARGIAIGYSYVLRVRTRPSSGTPPWARSPHSASAVPPRSTTRARCSAGRRTGTRRATSPPWRVAASRTTSTMRARSSAGAVPTPSSGIRRGTSRCSTPPGSTARRRRSARTGRSTAKWGRETARPARHAGPGRAAHRVPGRGRRPDLVHHANDSGSALVESSPGGFVVWGADGGITPLPLPAEGAFCRAADLNDRGAVTGSCSLPGENSHAVRWDLPVVGTW